MYSNMSSIVSYNNVQSREFSMKRGIRQGSSLSAKFYLVFINDLIEMLATSNLGATAVFKHR